MTLTVRAMLGISGKETDGTNAPSFDGTQPCMQVDPEIFFPSLQDVGSDQVMIKQELKRYKEAVGVAKTVCVGCHFKLPCLEYALRNTQQGVWGGTTDKERRNIKRRKRVA